MGAFHTNIWRYKKIATLRPTADRSPGELNMFGFQGGESTDTVARKKGYMKDARHRWSFRTNFGVDDQKRNSAPHHGQRSFKHVAGTGSARRSGLDAGKAVLAGENPRCE